jgi:hypothetical protein
MIKLTIFIIALLLAVEAIEPDAPWLVTLAVLTGIELLRWPFSAPRRIGRWMRRGWDARPWGEVYDW